MVEFAIRKQSYRSLNGCHDGIPHDLTHGILYHDNHLPSSKNDEYGVSFFKRAVFTRALVWIVCCLLQNLIWPFMVFLKGRLSTGREDLTNVFSKVEGKVNLVPRTVQFWFLISWLLTMFVLIKSNLPKNTQKNVIINTNKACLRSGHGSAYQQGLCATA